MVDVPPFGAAIRPRSRVGRADLVYLLQVGESCLESLAEDLGFERIEGPKTAAPAPQPSPRGPRGSAEETPKPSPVSGDRLRYYYVASRQQKRVDEVNWNEPLWFTQAQRLKPGDTLAEKTPRPSALIPLSPRERLLPFFLRILTRLRPGRRLHHRRLVARVGRGQPITHLPLRQRRRWSPIAQVILDKDPRLAPLWPDMDHLAETLVRHRGGEGLDIRTLPSGPEGLFRPWREMGGRHRKHALPPAGSPILVVSDLGCLAPGTSPLRAWFRFGRRLVNAGFCPIALVPFSPRHWNGELSPYWRPVFWDRGSRMRPVRPPRRHTVEVDIPMVAPENDAAVGRLLALLSPAVRIEPALLRAVRLALPRGEAEVTTEVLLWSHPHVFSDIHAMALLPDFIQTHRDAFEKVPQPKLKDQVLDQIRAHHVDLPSVIQDEERRTAAIMRGQQPENPSAADLMARVARTFADDLAVPQLRAWMMRLTSRQHGAMWQDKALAAAYYFAERPDESGEWHQLPAGFPIDDIAWAMKREPQMWYLWDHGLKRCWRPPSNRREDGDFPKGSPLAAVHSRTGLITVTAKGHSPQHLELADGLQLPEALTFGQGMILETDAAVLTLESRTSPKWAQSIGRDPRGLFVTFVQGDAVQKAYWLTPCRLVGEGGSLRAVVEGETSSLGEVEANDSSHLTSGCWIDEDLFFALTGPGLERPACFRQWGRDRHGLWADANLGNVRQRFRLVPPGCFAMGSPVNEPERDNDERQHQVHLTRPFWLAETACTQAHWKAVMGDNPSRFKGEDLPVETVSWDDVQGFIQKLNQAHPELALRLPTEAEWEYACRTGTTTPYSTGDNLTTDQANYDGNYPYAGGEKGIYREKTIAVTDLPPNPWGIFQMHGNVREWCADWFVKDYPEGTVLNPTGPETGVNRVLRGGSWILNARRARSAYRDYRLPSYRRGNDGFRLARGL